MNSDQFDSLWRPVLGRSAKLPSIILIVVWVMVDQGTKWWIVEKLANAPRSIRVAPFFDLVPGWNRGISFGILAGYQVPPWVLAVFSGAVAIVLLVWLFRTDDRFVGTGLALIIGGALGNALDRLRHGAVVDFLDFHLAGWHWPAFNFADVGVVCGAAVLIWDSLLRSGRDTA